MDGLRLIITLAAIWLAIVLTAWLVVIPWLRNGPRRDAALGVLWRVARILCRVVHRGEYLGLEDLRHRIDSGPLVVVSNHTGAIDPFLIQSACRFHIRWMMAVEQMTPAFKRVWEVLDVIPVARDGTDTGPAREAIRHVRGGGAVGIFPEGRIVTPPRQIWPFIAGVGLVVARTQAPVLLVWVSGTPDTNQLTKSLLTPSRARVEFVRLIHFEGCKDAAGIAEELRREIER
jgi:1-acyl-sn-glycerol-3-phosphate acyltransferase